MIAVGSMLICRVKGEAYVMFVTGRNDLGDWIGMLAAGAQVLPHIIIGTSQDVEECVLRKHWEVIS